MIRTTPWQIALNLRTLILLSIVAAGALDGRTEALAQPRLEVGLQAVEVTPSLDNGDPIWLAGLERNRAAQEVHDPLYARALVLRTEQKMIALVAVDSIGIQRPTVLSIRDKLAEFDYVLVASTHTHSAPDCVGLWGRTQAEPGVTESYMRQLEEGIVRAVRRAASVAVEARATYGTAEDQSLLADYRLPKVYDTVLRVIRFEQISDGKPCGILVQWNAHGVEPRNNYRVSRDFFGVTVDVLEERHECPVIYFSGAIGGLMGTPDAGEFLGDGKKSIRDAFHFMQLYGTAVADLADKALESSTPISLTPLTVSAKPVAIPLDNVDYRMARSVGVLTRPAFEWLEKQRTVGEPVPADRVEGSLALETEVAYLRLGDLHIAAIPGEIYPELVYGEFQNPADPGADFPDAPLEIPVMHTLPGDKKLLLGLANDEVGYILPKRQWDVKPPFCYGRDSDQYGEENSVGPETARLLTSALADRVRDASAR